MNHEDFELIFRYKCENWTAFWLLCCHVCPLDDSVEDFLHDVNHEDFELSFRYNFLAPPVDNLPVEVQGPYMEEIAEKVKENKFSVH